MTAVVVCVPARLIQHLVSEATTVHCELVDRGQSRRCRESALAVKWEDGFADFVCEAHAAGATERGALVFHARRHDGSDE